jgi:hypothetical protein
VSADETSRPGIWSRGDGAGAEPPTPWSCEATHSEAAIRLDDETLVRPRERRAGLRAGHGATAVVSGRFGRAALRDVAVRAVAQRSR